MADIDLAALEQAVAEHPLETEPLTELALAYSEAGRIEDAANALRKAAELAPTDLELLLGLAALEHVLGHSDAVDEAIRAALDQDPENPQVYRVIYQTSDRPDQVLDRVVGAARYLELQPDAADATTLADDLARLLRELAASHDALAAEAGEAPRVDGLQRLSELLLVMPYIRRALPADRLTPIEGELRAARVRIEASFVPPELPEEPVAAARARRAALPHVEAALEELGELAELGALDASLSALREQLVQLQTETAAQLDRLGLDADTEHAFSLLEEANASLAADQPIVALQGFQDCLAALAELGDDRSGRLAAPAAMAYNGLAQAVVATAPDEPAERLEHLEIALEAANEAAEREPGLKQPYREAMVAELNALRGQPDAPAESPAEEPVAEVPVPEPVAEPELPEPAAELLPETTVAEEEAEPNGHDTAAEPAVEAAVAEPVAAEAEPAPAEAEGAETHTITRHITGAEDVTELFGKAQEAYDAGQMAASRECFEAAAKLSDDRRLAALAYAGIGATYAAEGKRGEALTALDEATSLDSSCVDAHLVQGELAEQAGEWGPALSAYQFAEAAAPDDPRVHRGLGVALCGLEQWEPAVKMLEKALEADSDDPYLCFKMGEAFLGLGRRSHALACFEEALNLGLQPPDADDVHAFLRQEEERKQAAAARQKAAAAPKPAPATAEPEGEYDPDSAPPEVSRPKTEEDLDVRARVLRRAMSDMKYDAGLHERCPVCRFPNSKGNDHCERCNAPMRAPRPSGDLGARRGPCFVATAACGDPFAPEVLLLKAYRERCLRPHAAGRAVIALYETVSPPFARWLAAQDRLRAVVRRRLIQPLAWAALRWLRRGEA